MRKFEDYITSTSIEEDYRVLCDTGTLENLVETDDVIINLVVKYLAKYLGVTDITRQKLKSTINESILEDFPMSCIADIRSTSGLLKEIIFADDYQKSEKFVGIDLGTGTGILALGMAINASRNKIKEITCIGFDQEYKVLNKAEEVLGFVDGNIQFHEEDITDKELYEWIEKKNPSMVVSETINTSISSISVTEKGEITSITDAWDEVHSKIDPYKLVLTQLMARPKIREKIFSKEIYFFPNVINGGVRIDSKDSALKLRGIPEYVRLDEFRKRVFADYEDLNLNRWPAEDEREENEEKVKDAFNLRGLNIGFRD